MVEDMPSRERIPIAQLGEMQYVPWRDHGDPAPWFLRLLDERQINIILERQLERSRILMQHDLETIKALQGTLKKIRV